LNTLNSLLLIIIEVSNAFLHVNMQNYLCISTGNSTTARKKVIDK